MRNTEENLKLAQDQLKLSLETTHEFFDMWTKSYQSTLGKLAHMPAFGPIREKQEKIMKSIPLYTDLYTAWIESNINFQSVFAEATKRACENTMEKWSKSPEDISKQINLAKDGKGRMEPEKFKDLYKTWIDTYSETFKEFIESGHFASDMGKLSSIFMDFQKYNRETIEQHYLKPNNLPTKTEIDEINKEIYDLKKIIKELTRDVQELSKKEEKGEKGEFSINQVESEQSVKNKPPEKKEIPTK